MSYYRMGDYYMGDPGLLGSIGSILGKGLSAIGGVAKKVAPVLGGLLGGPVGGAIGGVIGAVSPATPRAPGNFLQGPVRPGGTPPVRIGQGPGIGVGGGTRIHPLDILPGGKPFITNTGDRAPSGYHYNKSRSYAQGAPPGTVLVPNRRMNPANPRALRRAIRREKAFIALARRTLKGTGITIGRHHVAAKKRRAR